MTRTEQDEILTSLVKQIARLETLTKHIVTQVDKDNIEQLKLIHRQLREIWNI
jgi:hypothetical protein